MGIMKLNQQMRNATGQHLLRYNMFDNYDVQVRPH